MKLFWSMIVVALLGLTAAGCGEKKSDSPTDATKQVEDDGGRGGANWPDVNCPPESAGGPTARARLMEIKQKAEDMFAAPETPEPSRPVCQQISGLSDQNLDIPEQPPRPEEFWNERSTAIFQAWTLMVEGEPDEAALAQTVVHLTIP